MFAPMRTVRTGAAGSKPLPAGAAVFDNAVDGIADGVDDCEAPVDSDAVDDCSTDDGADGEVLMLPARGAIDEPEAPTPMDCDTIADGGT